MVTGFVVPMIKEARGLIGRFRNKTELSDHGRKVICGMIGSRECALVISGCGKIASAAATQFIIDKLEVKELFHFGTAGSLVTELQIGDLIIADEIIEHDYLSRFGNDKNSAPLSKTTKELAEQLNQVAIRNNLTAIRGKIVSGNEDIVTKIRREELFGKHGGHCVDWESAGFAQVATIAKVPYGVVRGISDSAHEKTGSEFLKNLPLVSEKLALLFHQFLIS